MGVNPPLKTDVGSAPLALKRRRGAKQSGGLFCGGEPSPGVPKRLIFLHKSDKVCFFYTQKGAVEKQLLFILLFTAYLITLTLITFSIDLIDCKASSDTSASVSSMV